MENLNEKWEWTWLRKSDIAFNIISSVSCSIPTWLLLLCLMASFGKQMSISYFHLSISIISGVCPWQAKLAVIFSIASFPSVNILLNQQLCIMSQNKQECLRGERYRKESTCLVFNQNFWINSQSIRITQLWPTGIHDDFDRRWPGSFLHSVSPFHSWELGERKSLAIMGQLKLENWLQSLAHSCHLIKWPPITLFCLQSPVLAPC